MVKAHKDVKLLKPKRKMAREVTLGAFRLDLMISVELMLQDWQEFHLQKPFYIMHKSRKVTFPLVFQVLLLLREKKMIPVPIMPILVYI